MLKVRTSIFDIGLEFICNHARLHSILRGFICLRPPSATEKKLITIKINSVENIDFSSYSLDSESSPILDLSVLKIFSDKTHKYFYYTDFKTYIINLKSKSEMEVEVCKGLLNCPDFIKYCAISPGLIEILKWNNIFILHAAALEKGKTGYLFPGRSNSGKTTLSLSLIKTGYGFLSDDMVFIKYPAKLLEASILTKRDLNIKKKMGFISRIVSEFKGNSLVMPGPDKSIKLSPAIICRGLTVKKIKLDKIIFLRITKRGKSCIAKISQNHAFHLLMKGETLSVYGNNKSVQRYIGCFKKISSLEERYLLSLGRDALADQKTISRILDGLKKE